MAEVNYVLEALKFHGAWNGGSIPLSNHLSKAIEFRHTLINIQFSPQERKAGHSHLLHTNSQLAKLVQLEDTRSRSPEVARLLFGGSSRNLATLTPQITGRKIGEKLFFWGFGVNTF